MPMIPDTAECFANHMGFWLCKPTWLAEAVAHIRAGTWQPEARTLGEDRDLFRMASGGTAVIEMNGPMMKGMSKFGGASTIQTRRALRQAVMTDEVEGILLHIDSPGGHVAGTQDLANDVAAANRQKPVHAHIDDMGASAALWVASQAGRVTANATAEVGSVGVIGVLEDSSGAAEREGIKVHAITTGPFKAMGLPGTPVTEAHIDHAQDLVDGLFAHFRGALASGRGLNAKQLDAVSDGRTWLAGEALALGLIDEVMSADDALASFPDAAAKRRRKASDLAYFRKAALA